MSLFRNVAIVGGTGALGKHIVQAICAEKDRFLLTAITRKTGDHQFPDSVNIVVVDDYHEDNELLFKTLVGQDVLIAAHNVAAAPRANAVLLSCAIKAGVKRFVPSEYSGDIEHPGALALAAPGSLLEKRYAMVKHLASVATSGDITYTLFVPAGWMDQGLVNGFLGFDIKARQATLVDQGIHKATGCTKPFIAQAVVDMLRRFPSQTENKKIHIAEVEYSGGELLADLEDETGSKWSVTHVTSAALIARAEEAADSSDLRGSLVPLIHVMNYGGSGAAHFPEALSSKGVGSQAQRKTLRQIVKEAVREVAPVI